MLFKSLKYKIRIMTTNTIDWNELTPPTSSSEEKEQGNKNF